MKQAAQGYGHIPIAGIGDLILMTLLLLAGIGLVVPLQDGWRLNKRLNEDRARLAELEILHPLYVEFATLDKSVKWPSLVPLPAQKLTEDEVSAIPARFTEMATRCELELATVDPRLNRTEAGNCLDVELVGSGPYRQLNPFLLELARLPMLEAILKLELRRETMNEQFNILVRLALE